MSKEEKLKAQELKRLLKKMGQKKTPTMIYQMGSPKKGPRRDDVNPW
jgi:Ca-activated chloride channel family protein